MSPHQTARARHPPAHLACSPEPAPCPPHPAAGAASADAPASPSTATARVASPACAASASAPARPGVPDPLPARQSPGVRPIPANHAGRSRPGAPAQNHARCCRAPPRPAQNPPPPAQKLQPPAPGAAATRHRLRAARPRYRSVPNRHKVHRFRPRSVPPPIHHRLPVSRVPRPHARQPPHAPRARTASRTGKASLQHLRPPAPNSWQSTIAAMTGQAASAASSTRPHPARMRAQRGSTRLPVSCPLRLAHLPATTLPPPPPHTVRRPHATDQPAPAGQQTADGHRHFRHPAPADDPLHCGADSPVPPGPPRWHDVPASAPHTVFADPHPAVPHRLQPRSRHPRSCPAPVEADHPHHASAAAHPLPPPGAQRRRTAGTPADTPAPWTCAPSPRAPGHRHFPAAGGAPHARLRGHPAAPADNAPGRARPPGGWMPAAAARSDAADRSAAARPPAPASGAPRQNPAACDEPSATRPGCARSPGSAGTAPPALPSAARHAPAAPAAGHPARTGRYPMPHAATVHWQARPPPAASAAAPAPPDWHRPTHPRTDRRYGYPGYAGPF